MIITRIILIFSLISSVSLMGGLVDKTSAETLNESLVRAYNSNPKLIAERSKVRAIDEKVSQAMAKRRPEIRVSGNYGYRKISRKYGSGASTDISNQPQSIDLAISQNLFRGYRTQAELNIAENKVAAARSSLIDAEQSIFLEVVDTFVTVLRDDAVLDLQNKNVVVIKQQLQAVRDRFDVGELTRTDVAQGESRLARAIADKASAFANAQKSRAELHKLTGNSALSLNQPSLPDSLPGSVSDTVALALNNNPQIVTAEFNERAARHAIKVAEGHLLPTVTVDAILAREKDIISSGNQDTKSTLRARFSIPIFQSGAEYSLIREAKQTASRRLSELAISRRFVENRARDAWENFMVAQARITSFEVAVRAQEIAFEGVEQESKVGSRTILDVLDAEQELLDSKVKLENAKRVLIVSGFSLLSVTGKLTADNLGLGVDIYDPSENLENIRNKLFGRTISVD
ncbi:MAG: TolC family outer membrane protein [Alphaproteobacteria bacterium]|nr:TolC family outer membrane protein [Alphaproteobacteria bacterium]